MPQANKLTISLKQDGPILGLLSRAFQPSRLATRILSRRRELARELVGRKDRVCVCVCRTARDIQGQAMGREHIFVPAKVDFTGDLIGVSNITTSLV